jgi:uncharacterized protein
MTMDRICYSLITGASEGLGKALAFECAARKMNLMLVALPGSGLHELGDFIHRNFGVSVMVSEKDLSDPASCRDLFREIQQQGLRLRMLINNAGLGGTNLFCEGSLELYEKQIRLNVLATTVLTHLFLDNLERNGPSYILNVGSMASFFFLPRKQVYGATKSYIHFFSKSLRKEVKGDGIRVSVLCPGGINTNLSVTMLNKSGTWLSRLSVMNPEQVAPTAIDGLLKGKEVIVPGALNKCFMLFDKILPSFIKTKLTGYSMRKLQVDNRYLAMLRRHPAVSESLTA